MSEITYRTEDGVTVKPGDRIFDYYSFKAGHIAPQTRYAWGDPEDPWFDVIHDDGTRSVLNGQRICSVAYAQRRKWMHSDQCEVTRSLAQLKSELAEDPKNPYLLGALPEYSRGGDQEVELCDCGVVK